MHLQVEVVKADIEKLVNNPAKLPWYMTVDQLTLIRELDKLNQLRDIKSFMPFYPRGITDAWDCNDGLVKELLKVLDIYMKF